MWDLVVSVPDHCLSFYFTIGMIHAHMKLAQWYMTRA